MSEENNILRLPRDMAMVRSSLKDMWNLSCEGGTYLYTHLKMGASFMFQTWQRGLLCLLVLASLPFLAPLIFVAMMVGGVFLVPFLCGVLAYYALFHRASLSNIKWFRSPKSVLRSEPRSTELVMEDLDFHGVGNRNRRDSLGISNLDQESIDQGREPKNEESKAVALIAPESMQHDEVAFSGVSAREGSTEGIEVEPQQKGSVVDFSFETPLEVESNQQLGGYEDAQGEELIPGGNERGQEREDLTFSASSYGEAVKGGSSHEIESVDTAPDNSLAFVETLGNEAILEEVNKDVADFSNAGRAPEQEGSALGVPSIKELADEETMEYKDVVLHGRDEKGQEEENRPSDSLLSEELVEAKSSLEEIGEHSTDDSYPVVENQDLKSEEAEYNAFHFDDEERDEGEDQSMSLESPDNTFLEDEFPVLEITASGFPLEELNLPTDREEPSQLGTTEAQFASEDSKVPGEPESEAVEEKEDGHLVGRKQELFDEYKAEYKESGQAVSVSTQPLLSEGYLEHSEDELPLKDAVQQVDDTAAVEGEPEPNYESAADSFSHSDYEQEQVDVIQTNAEKLNEDTGHGLEGDTELYLKGVGAKRDVPADEVDVPVVQEVELPVSQSLLEKEVRGVEAEAVAAPAFKPAAPVTEEKSPLVEDVAPMAGVASVGVAAVVEEAIANKASEPAPQVIEEELKAPAPAPEVLKGVEAPVAEDASMLERESFALQVVTEDEAPTVKEETEVPLVLSGPVSEETDASLVEEDVPALLLASEASRMEQRSLPVDSEPVELTFPVADAPVIAEAAPTEVVASGEDSDANDLYVQRAPVVEKTTTPMKDVISERVEDSKAPVLAEKGVEASIEEAAGPESAAAQASASIVETEATKEIDSNLDEVSVELEKEKVDPLLESTASITEQHSLPVESEPMELASSVEGVPAIAEAAPVPEAASTSATVPVGESDAKDVEVSEASIEEKNKADLLLDSSASMIDQRSLLVESEPVELASSVQDIPSIAEAVLAQEAKSPSASVEESDAKDVEVSEAQMGIRKERDGPVLESSTSIPDQQSLPVDSESVKLASPVKDITTIAEAAPVQDAGSVETAPLMDESDAKEAEAPAYLIGEEKEKAGPVLESSASTTDQQSLPVESQAVKLASPIEDIPAIAEAAPVQEAESASASVEEFDAKDVEVSEAQLGEEEASPVLESPASMMDQKSLPVDSEPVELASPVEDITATSEAAPVLEAASGEAAALVEDSDAKKAEEWEALVLKGREVEASIKEVGASDADALIVEPDVALAEMAEDSVTPVVKEKEAKSPVAAFEKVEVEESPVVIAPAQEGAASEAEGPVVEERELDAHVAEASIEEEKVGEASEAEAPFTEPEVTKDVAPAFVAAEEAPDVREVELPLAVSEPVSEEQEAPEVESLAVPDLEPKVPVVAEKSLPVQELQVGAAPVEESFLTKVREPEASVVENTEGADDSALHISSQVDSGASSEATTVELISPLTTSEANRESGSGERRDRIASDLEPPLNVEDSMAVDENLNQASKDRSVKVSDTELKNASNIAQLGEHGHEAVQKLEERYEKDKVMESHTEQDVFPTLKPLNVVQSKDSSHNEQVEESDSVSNRAPTHRQISVENVRADEEVKMRVPSSPSHRTGAEGTNSNFVFKSHLGRDHRTYRHSAPDFLGTQTWVREAPFYSPQSSSRGHKKAKYKKWSEFDGGRPARSLSAPFSDSTEAHMGEFESLLQSWQERDKATHSPTRVSPSSFPSSPAEIGRQIREEINTIQKIIGQDIPPQYSLWKEVEALCQIVGMELPYMGDVSDLIKARNGLDLLKVVVGINWT